MLLKAGTTQINVGMLNQIVHSALFPHRSQGVCR